MSNNQFSNNKLFYHDDKVRSILNGKMTLPSVMELSLSGRCNQDCIYCCNSPFREMSMLSKLQIDNIIDQLIPFIKAVTITGGGEPTLNANFLYCINKLANNGISYGVITNGADCTKDQMESIVSSASFCRISLDSTDSEIYQQIRNTKKSVFGVLDNIKMMAIMKSESRSRILLGVHIVWTNQSLTDIEKTVQTVKKLKIDFIQIRPVDNIPYNDFSPDYLRISDGKLFLNQLVEKYSDSEFSVILNVAKFEEYFNQDIGKKYVGCPGGNLTASIGHDNKVYFCCTHLGNKDFALGDLSDFSLASILQSKMREEIINNCNHLGCQYQCRNHNINNILSNLNKEKIEELYCCLDLGNAPLHWQFL